MILFSRANILFHQRYYIWEVLYFLMCRTRGQMTFIALQPQPVMALWVWALPKHWLAHTLLNLTLLLFLTFKLSLNIL